MIKGRCEHDYGASGYCLKCGTFHFNYFFKDEPKQKTDPYSWNVSTTDNVNQPNHYKFGSLETIEVIKGSMPKEQYIGYLKGNIIKYICRAQYKNKVEDLNKAGKYLKWLKGEINA